MSQFATAADLAARLGLTLTGPEQTRAGLLLTIASGVIQDEAKQTISLVEDDVLTLPGTTDDLIKLPERPVVEVTSITLNGAALTEGTDWYLDGNAIARLSSLSVLAELATPLPTRGFGSPNQTLAITYTHGYETIPGAVQAICLEMVVRVWVNPGAVSGSRVGDTYDSFDDQGMMLTDAERRTIRRLFGRSAKSITIGR